MSVALDGLFEFDFHGNAAGNGTNGQPWAGHGLLEGDGGQEAAHGALLSQTHDDDQVREESGSYSIRKKEQQCGCLLLWTAVLLSLTVPHSIVCVRVRALPLGVC